MYFWLCWVFLAVHGLSLVAARWGLLFVAVHGLLIVVASLVAHRLSSLDLAVVTHRLSCPVARGIFSD